MPDSPDVCANPGEERLARFRAFYADLVTSHIADAGRKARLRHAFSSTRREQFCGPGPWGVFSSGSYVVTPSGDPAFLYQDVVVALDESRGINNGQPTLHAISLAALNVADGETVVHIGAGTGYYTAILAVLAGETGRVIAYEIDPDLGAEAKENLKGYSNVQVLVESGTSDPLPHCDVIYVNAGATDPLPVWLDALRPGGRLLFPLTPDKGFGAMLLIERQHGDAEAPSWAARFVSQALFIGCIGGRREESAKRLEEAFGHRDFRSVQSMQRDDAPDDTCWVAGDGWWLSTASPG